MSSSRLYDIEDEEFQELLDSSSSLAEVIRRVGMSKTGANYNTLRKRITQGNLSLETLEENRKVHRKNNGSRPLPLEEFMVKDSSLDKSTLRRKVLSNKLFEYKCSECEFSGDWRGKPLALQLDHINGNNKDHRKENLRWLCPNCHTQTITYGNKSIRRKRKEWTCKKCFTPISFGSIHCTKCAEHPAARKFEITKEELDRMINQEKITYTSIGEKFGVTGNTIKKRARKLGISLPKRR